MPTPLILQPNMEKIVSGWLRTVPELEDLVDDRVYTATPAKPDFPLIRVLQIIDIKVTRQPLWIVAYQIQVEAFGGGKAMALLVATTAAAALDQRLAGVIEVDSEAAVVTGVDVGGLMDLPDEDYEPARPRFLFTSTITAHPVATLAAS